jgi:cytochrome c oxidase cbb3-type subunit 1
MWREYGADGYLVNSFAETIAAIRPMFILRAFGGLLYLAGAGVFAFNIAMTIAGRLRTEKPMTETPHDPARDRPLPVPPAPVGALQPAE